MNAQDKSNGGHTGGENKTVNLLDYVGVIVKWRKFIIINLLVVTILAAVVSLLLPRWYKATVSILPPKEQGTISQYGAVGTLLKGLSPAQRISGFGQDLGVYNYLAILKSRSAMEEVIRKFDLIKVYGVSDNSIETTIRGLRDNVSFEIQDEDYITIDVLDKSPQRAADIANYFVEVLNNISNQLGTREARDNREFIEKRLETSKGELRDAEEALRSYQEKSGVLVAPEQNTSSVSAMAELYGMKAKKEVELAIMERSVTKDNEALQQLKIELSELGKKIATFPEAGIESFRLYRDVAIQQKVVEFLVPLFEQAKIDEQKDVPVILVLDKAVPPEKPFKPSRRLVVFVGFIVGVFLSFLVITVKERYSTIRATSPEIRERIKQLRSTFKSVR